MREFEVMAADGTRLRGWRTDGQGPPVLLCPGLGTPPEAWPALHRIPHGGARPHAPVVSWYHRGTMGSHRPADERRIGLEDHVADAVAVLDAAGIRRCVVLGWSVGVLVATELARRHPARVSGLLLAAGVPGDLFGAMFGVLGLPVALRRALAYGGAHAIKAAAPLVDAVLHRIPANTATATLLQRVGLLAAGARPEEVAVAMRRFLQHDWRWYINLALAVGSLPVPHLDWITCPVTVLAGRYDLMADPNSTIRPFSCLPQARTRVIPATHLLPLEAPEVLAEELTLLVDRVAAVEQALAQGRPKRQPIDALIPPMLTYGSRRGA